LHGNFIFGAFIEICLEHPKFVKLGQKYGAVYMKIEVHFFVSGEVNSP
jgi:hypothetical protein